MADFKLGYPNQASGDPFTSEQIDELMNTAFECALNWTTQDGWAVGVMHVFVWHEDKVWLNFMGHRSKTKGTDFRRIVGAKRQSGQCQLH